MFKICAARNIGVTRFGSSSDFAVREYLQRNKLNLAATLI